MKSVDNILFNVLVLTIPFLISYIFWLDRSELSPAPQRGRWRPLWIGAINAASALFCITHPFFAGGACSGFDLRFIPLLLAFLYGGFVSGLIVTGAIVFYLVWLGGSNSIWIVSIAAVLVPFILAFIWLSNWKRKAPKIMFPTLLALVSAVAACCILLIYRTVGGLSVSPSFWAYGAMYCLLNMMTMGLITCMIERIRDNAAMRQELVRSEKLHVIGELAASVAHEIRNPMTVARGFMQIISQSRVPEEKLRMYTGMVMEEIDRAQQIICDYLSFAKPQAEKLQQLDVSRLTQKLTNLISPYAAMCGVELAILIENELWVEANAEKMLQCLVNLTKNGIEAMPDGGVLRVLGYTRGSKVVLEIADNGVGMTYDQLQQLGTPFYSTKHKGTGLGMMVSYRIIRALGGDIEMDSEPGKGTNCRIILPLLPGENVHDALE
ncbi:hypothetical protein B5M42_005450 [Paenibacillus athensensis]|uniref:histidine kinase n=1 Tax=Paenibacillus athensensis TaxID=1967502 RepID=A0A4Y8Q0T8_9BACL|nr:ATP-binding protein [Paenibacillus athensensis]MCD1258286.1 hypothetical protein [Paenibacillus athensensis]